MTNGRQGRSGMGRAAGRDCRARPFPALPAIALASTVTAALLSGCGGPPPPGEPIPVTDIFGGLGDMPGRFGYPRGIDIAPESGLLWVVDKTGRIQGLDPETGRCEVLWTMPERDLGKPVGLTVAPGPDETGRWCKELLYVADTHYHRVLIYKPPATERGREAPARGAEPTLVRTIGSYGTGPGQFRYPTDVAVVLGADRKSIDRIYVSEYGGNDRVNIFDGAGAFVSCFGTFGAGTDEQPGSRAVEFARPQSISVETVAGKQEVIVVDAHNHRIGRFTPDGELVLWYGGRDRPGDKPGEFRYPYGLASMGDGTVLICEFGNNRVQRIDLATGEGLGSWGRAGRGEGELAAPWAVGILGRTAYVVDSGNNRILAFNAPPPRRR